MGELLHFYMSNKLKIKRRLAKYKKQYTKLSKIPSEEEFADIVSKLKVDNDDDNGDDDDDVVLLSISDSPMLLLPPVIDVGCDELEVVFRGLLGDILIDRRFQQRLDGVWNRQEVFSFFQALGMFGENFLLIARYVGNKTESMVKLFYAQNVKNVV